MKYVDEFRDGELAKTIAARVASAADTGRIYVEYLDTLGNL